MNTHFPNTVWFRTNQGPTMAQKINEATATPAIDFRPALCLRYHAQNPETGRKEIVDGFVSATTPHKAPNHTHAPAPSRSSTWTATRKMSASRKGEMVGSHTQRIDQYQTYGNNPHAHVDQRASTSPSVLRAIK